MDTERTRERTRQRKSVQRGGIEQENKRNDSRSLEKRRSREEGKDEERER